MRLRADAACRRDIAGCTRRPRADGFCVHTACVCVPLRPRPPLCGASATHRCHPPHQHHHNTNTATTTPTTTRQLRDALPVHHQGARALQQRRLLEGVLAAVHAVVHRDVRRRRLPARGARGVLLLHVRQVAARQGARAGEAVNCVAQLRRRRRRQGRVRGVACLRPEAQGVEGRRAAPSSCPTTSSHLLLHQPPAPTTSNPSRRPTNLSLTTHRSRTSSSRATPAPAATATTPRTTPRRTPTSTATTLALLPPAARASRTCEEPKCLSLSSRGLAALSPGPARPAGAVRPPGYCCCRQCAAAGWGTSATALLSSKTNMLCPPFLAIDLICKRPSFCWRR